MTKRISRSGRSEWIERPCGCAYWHNEKRKLCKHDVRMILRLLRRHTHPVIAEQFGVTPSNIQKINAGKSWREVA